MRVHRVICRLGLAAAFAAPLAGAAPAAVQEVERIVAVVNDEVISAFDLEQRLRLLMLLSGRRSSSADMQRIAPQVLGRLIDERLRLQEAKRYNISVSENELDREVADIEKRNKFSAVPFQEFLKARNISLATVKSQLRSELAWTKLVSQRLRQTMTISDDEVDEELKRIKASQGMPEYLASEIFLVVESTSKDAVMRQNAMQLVKQIREEGTDFATLARQFSDGSTAARGGDMGWVQQHQLTTEVAAALDALAPGQVSDPIPSNGGYLIAYLRERRLRMVANPDNTKVALKQIILPASATTPKEESQVHLALAETIRSTVTDCDDMTRVATEIDPSTSGDLGTVRLGDLPPDLRRMVRDLPVGTISAPTETKLGVLLLMVCDRVEPKVNLPDHERVRRRLLGKKFELLSRRYLRDLRRIAYVDTRI